jgi:hypothetical protein
MGDLNDGPYNKSVKYLAPKQKKPQYQSLGYLTHLKKWLRKDKEPLRTVMHGIFSIKLCFPKLCIAQLPFLKAGIQQTLFDTKQRTI